ncbi:MAG: type II toxin-antitoxin system VapC family toxin [Acidobacteria bacterium]|nr:type II toxin-antitoxin system VapC family toxin [Acidobacteriota bacterium]
MQKDLAAAEELIQLCPILPFDSNAARIAAHITAHLSRNMSRKELKDVFIAATVLAHGYGIVTRNRKDFQLIASHLPIMHSILYLTNWNF